VGWLFFKTKKIEVLNLLGQIIIAENGVIENWKLLKEIQPLALAC